MHIFLDTDSLVLSTPIRVYSNDPGPIFVKCAIVTMLGISYTHKAEFYREFSGWQAQFHALVTHLPNLNKPEPNRTDFLQKILARKNKNLSHWILDKIQQDQMMPK
jgi:hypothetical protein